MGFWDLFSSNKQIKRKRVFISFAIEDIQYRDFLVDQSKKNRSPFSFIDMSAKKEWEQHKWQKMCRTKIKRSDGVIALLSKSSYHAKGARWEMKCAKEENIKIIGMHIKKNNKGAIPTELRNEKIIDWTWENLKREIEKF